MGVKDSFTVGDVAVPRIQPLAFVWCWG